MLLRPETNQSYFERITRLIIERIFLGYKFPNCKPDFLYNPVTNRRLELDCYNKELKLAIETDGKQHECAISFSKDTSLEKKEELFKKIQQNDKIKNEKCADIGINLIRIRGVDYVKKIKSYSEYVHFVYDIIKKNITDENKKIVEKLENIDIKELEIDIENDLKHAEINDIIHYTGILNELCKDTPYTLNDSVKLPLNIKLTFVCTGGAKIGPPHKFKLSFTEFQANMKRAREKGNNHSQYFSCNTCKTISEDRINYFMNLRGSFLKFKSKTYIKKERNIITFECSKNHIKKFKWVFVRMCKDNSKFWCECGSKNNNVKHFVETKENLKSYSESKMKEIISFTKETYNMTPIDNKLHGFNLTFKCDINANHHTFEQTLKSIGFYKKEKNGTSGCPFCKSRNIFYNIEKSQYYKLEVMNNGKRKTRFICMNYNNETGEHTPLEFGGKRYCKTCLDNNNQIKVMFQKRKMFNTNNIEVWLLKNYNLRFIKFVNSKKKKRTNLIVCDCKDHPGQYTYVTENTCGFSKKQFKNGICCRFCVTKNDAYKDQYGVWHFYIFSCKEHGYPILEKVKICVNYSENNTNHRRKGTKANNGLCTICKPKSKRGKSKINNIEKFRIFINQTYNVDLIHKKECIFRKSRNEMLVKCLNNSNHKTFKRSIQNFGYSVKKTPLCNKFHNACCPKCLIINPIKRYELTKGIFKKCIIKKLQGKFVKYYLCNGNSECKNSNKENFNHICNECKLK